jgi:uncharacterized protein (DUF488 family)
VPASLKAQRRGDRYAVAVWTIGHSTRTLDEVIALLRAHGVSRVVDVRRFPRSRRHPHFDADALARDLPHAGIAYLHTPGLGGFRRAQPHSINTGLRNRSFQGYADYMQTADFAHHLATLIAEAADTPTAIMCAESTPWRCHRSLIADALTAQGVEVHHILGTRRALPHTLTAGARIESGRVTYPGQTNLLGE